MSMFALEIFFTIEQKYMEMVLFKVPKQDYAQSNVRNKRFVTNNFPRW